MVSWSYLLTKCLKIMGTLCIVGGTIGFARYSHLYVLSYISVPNSRTRTRSIPSIVAGVGVGLLYLWSANSIVKGTPNGLQAALGKSAAT